MSAVLLAAVADTLAEHALWGRSAAKTLVCGGSTCTWEQPWPPDAQAGCGPVHTAHQTVTHGVTFPPGSPGQPYAYVTGPWVPDSPPAAEGGE